MANEKRMKGQNQKRQLIGGAIGTILAASMLTSCMNTVDNASIYESDAFSSQKPSQHLIDDLSMTPSSNAIPTSTALPTLKPTSTPYPTKTSSPTLTPTQSIVPTTTQHIEPYSCGDVESIPYNPAQVVPVLEYHNPNYKGEVRMTSEMLDQQLDYLVEQGFCTPNEEELLGWLDKRHGLPKKSIILRTDMGIPTLDYIEGYELYKEHNFNSITFILTGTMPKTCRENELCWDHVLEWINDGVAIPGSHGKSHPNYATINSKMAVYDASNSKDDIEAMIGRRIFFFSYPYDSMMHGAELHGLGYRILFGNQAIKGASSETGLAGTLYSVYAPRGGSFDIEKFTKSIDYVLDSWE